jgi:hypothetical protein
MIEVFVDEKRIPMNKYVKNVFSAVIEAMVSTLKGVDENWSKIEIRLER